MTPRRIALLLELPADSPDMIGMIALRRLLKGLLRAYGIRCLSIRDPKDTATFRSACEQPNEPKQPSTYGTQETRC